MKRLWLILSVTLMLACGLTLVACNGGVLLPGFDGTMNNVPGGMQTGAPHEHTFGAWQAVVEATCETAGFEVRYCACGVREERECAALGHACSEFDYTYCVHYGICSRCGENATESHEFSEGTYTCTVCPFSVEVPSSPYREVPPEFTTGFVTTEVTFVETEYAIYEIGPGVYVVNDLAQKTDALCRALETVTGLCFENASYDGKKILIGVYNNFAGSDLTVDGFPVNGTAAYGECVSGRGDECMHLIKINPENLFLGQSVTIAHELAHVLRYYQSNYHFNTIIEEGFAQLACESVLVYLEEHDVALAQSLWYWLEGASNFGQSVYDEELPTQDIQYWFETMRNVGHNHAPYVFGDRLMRYLKEEYGQYTAWISFIPERDGGLIQPSAQEEIAIFEAAYGNRVFEDFYAWDEKYTAEIGFRGAYSPYSTATYDLSELDHVVIYPRYANMRNAVPGENVTSLGVRYSFTYQDLYINIDETVRYLRDFKGENIDDLMLSLSDAALVYVFDMEGNFLRAVYAKQIPLQDVGYIKLVGDGYMGCLEIVGYYPESEQITQTVTLFSGSCDEQTSMEFVAWHYQLLFRDDVTVILKLSTPCSLYLVDLDWNFIKLEDVTELELDGYRYCRVFNWTCDFDYTVIAIPTSP